MWRILLKDHLLCVICSGYVSHVVTYVSSIRVTCGVRLYLKNKMATMPWDKLIDKSSNEKDCFLLTSILNSHLIECCPINYNIHANNVLCASTCSDSMCHLQKWTLRWPPSPTRQRGNNNPLEGWRLSVRVVHKGTSICLLGDSNNLLIN